MTHDRASWYYFRTRSHRPNRKVDGLQRHTASVTECAWPDCDRSTPETFAENRLGVLCIDHAWSHYDAMNQYLVWNNTVESPVCAALRARQVPLDAVTDEEIAAAKELRKYGDVYYLRVGERIKIGFSSDVHQRLRSYPPGSVLLALEPGDKKLERQRHHEFGDFLLAGREWFEPSDKLMAHIQQLVDAHGLPDFLQPKYREPIWRRERRQPMKYVRR